MEKQILERLIDEKLTQRAIGARYGLSQSAVRYWLKVHGISTVRTNESPGCCRVCDKPLKTTRRHRCGACNTAVRRLRTKLRAIEMLGGCCQKCGWVGPPAGFDFHHPEDNKEFEIGSVANKAWASIVEEIKKCQLLCGNCHSIEHSNHLNERLLAEVYKGTS